MKKKMTKSEDKLLEAAAIVAASRRYDYEQLNRERKKLGLIIEHASEDYRKAEERMKKIEEEEHKKMVEEMTRPRQGWFW